MRSPRLGVDTDGGTPSGAEGHVHGMTTPDPLIDDLRAAIEKVAWRIVERPDWLRDVSPTDLALVERVLELAVLVLGGRKDVIH